MKVHCELCDAQTTPSFWKPYLGYLCSRCRRVGKKQIEAAIDARARANIPFMLGEIARINVAPNSNGRLEQKAIESGGGIGETAGGGTA